MNRSRFRHRDDLTLERLEQRSLLAASAFRFDNTNYEASATRSQLYIEIDRTGDDSTDETVEVTTSDGTAVGGVDYEAERFRFTFPSRTNQMPIPLTILNPGVSATPTKSFTVSLSDPGGDASVVSPSTTTVTIDEPLARTATTTTVTAATNGGGIPLVGALNLGAGVTFTAEVDRSHLGVNAPTGTVTFSFDGFSLPPVNLTMSGIIGANPTAEFFTNQLILGQHTITAVYNGDSSATTSMGSTTVTVAPATTVKLVESTAAAVVGQPVTLTEQVKASGPTATTPTGTVTFDFHRGLYSVGLPIPPEESATVALVPSATTPGLATATYTTSDLVAGAHAVIPTYSGDATFAPHTEYDAGLISVSSLTYPTTTVLTASTSPTVPGLLVTVTAQVTGTSSQNPLVEGNSSELGFVAPTVTFTIDGVAQTPVAITASATNPLVATAQFSSTALAVGTHQISAVFNDGSNLYNAPSVGTLSLPPGSTTTTGPVIFVPTQTYLTPVPVVPVVGHPFVVIATVFGAAPVPTAAPTGTVEFFDDGTPVATLPLNGNGQAVLFLPSLAAGPHGFTVVYGGDASNGGGIGNVTPVVARVQRATAGNTTALVLTIGGGSLDPTSAQTVSNYQLTGPLNRSVKIRSATYNAAAATVTLRLASALNLRSTYTLQVIGSSPSGLRGTNGSLLGGELVGGNAGIAGTSYQTVVNSSTPVRSQVQVRAATAHPQAHLATQHQVAPRSAPARIV